MTVAFTAQEIERLLDRPVRARVGVEERAAYRGRRVLVTGAGGSIGSELARELAQAGCAAVALLDHGELALFNLERDLRGRGVRAEIVPYLCDVTQRAVVRRIVLEFQPDAVFHAAAYKHVTMAERAPLSAASVNVVGAAQVASAAAAVGARFVLISSDKAADPCGVMGATKRLAERLTLAMATPSFRPIVVRFGNVLGSSGSVLQIMRECIRGGRPVPLTDPDATRYFMSVGEAVALVLRADMIARAPEIFWLEMGDPVGMLELTQRLMQLEADAGFRPVPIDIIGLRPGEKRSETLTDRSLTFARTIDRRIHVARETALRRDLADSIVERLRRAIARADDAAALETIAGAVPGFAPSAQALAAARRTMPATRSGKSESASSRRRGHAA